MKHTSKRLLSFLLCLVLMLSLVPLVYADAEVNYTKAQAQKLAAEMRILASETADANDADALRSLADSVEGAFNDPTKDQSVRNMVYEYAKDAFLSFDGDPAKLVVAPDAPDAPDKIDLTPAYEARERLYAALGELGARTACVKPASLRQV